MYGWSPPASLALIFLLKVFEPLHVLQIPLDRRLLTIDLERVQCLVPPGIARGLEEAERSIREAAQECTGVIDSDLFDFARERMLTLLDECFGHRAHGLDSTVEPDGRVNAVRQ